MNHIRPFNEFLKEGAVRRQTPDRSRANSLLNESEDSFKVLNEFNFNNFLVLRARPSLLT